MGYILFMMLGAVFGLVFCILLFQMDSQWKWIFSIGGGGGFIASFHSIMNTLKITQNRLPLFVCYVFSMIVCGIAIFLFLCWRLNKQDFQYKLRPMDIILGRKNTLEEYYASRRNEIDKQLNIYELEAKRLELEAKEKAILDKERFIEEQMERAKEVAATGTYIELPYNKTVSIDNSFLNVLPEFTFNLANYVKELNKLTEQFLDKYPGRREEDFAYLKGYLLAICNYTSLYLFDSNTNVRTHFRYLDEDNNYVKLVASVGSSPVNQPLTPICSSKGMIHEAGRMKRSVIKSLNADFHITACNDHIWEDYITVVFDNFYVNTQPVITMGISVKNKEHYRRNLYFLNHCKIEMIIQENLLKMHEKCNILDCIKGVA
ncbi:hypothetical protein [Phosphitispora sp. TUW77]|uniref:hypothetical protein n=1 Tax=Phosphitispora sp. TUW77 TaxID=3152361 RepID=UPI003AB701C9